MTQERRPPPAKTVPAKNQETSFYWDKCKEHELWVRKCNDWPVTRHTSTLEIFVQTVSREIQTGYNAQERRHCTLLRLLSGLLTGHGPTIPRMWSQW